MEINPFSNEQTYTKAEWLAAVVDEYNRVGERRIYLAGLIREAAQAAPDMPLPTDIQLELDREAFLDASDEV